MNNSEKKFFWEDYSDEKLLNVAMMLGYENASSFTRAFLRWAGMTPKEYRSISRNPSWAERYISFLLKSGGKSLKTYDYLIKARIYSRFLSGDVLLWLSIFNVGYGPESEAQVWFRI